MDSQHERQQSRLEARSEAYSRQGRPEKGLSASRDRSQHLHPGGLGKDPQVQHPIEPRTQTGQGRQGRQFFPTVRKTLPAKGWRKLKKDKEAINLSVKLAEKPEVKRRGYIWPYGADKAEPVTRYPAGPYGAAKAEIVPIYPTYPQAGASSHPRPHPPLHNHQHNPPLPPYAVADEHNPPPPPYTSASSHPRPHPPLHNHQHNPPPLPYSEIINRPPNQGYPSFPPPYSHDIGPPHQGYPPYPPPYYPPVPAYPQDYNIGPPNQGYYQTFPPTYSPGYLPPGYHRYPPPYPQVYTRPPNQGYQPSPPPPFQGYETVQHIASSVLARVAEDFINSTFLSNGNNDGSYDGGPSF